MRVIHYDKGYAGLSCIIPRDLHNIACKGTYISLSEEPERMTRDPLKVTCHNCLRAYQFGQGNWRERLAKD